MIETDALDAWNASPSRILKTSLRVRRDALVRLKQAVAGAQDKGAEILLQEVVSIAFEGAAAKLEEQYGPLSPATLTPGRRRKRS